MKHLKRLYEHGGMPHVDLTVVCRDEEMKCHKIICCQSPFFEAACSDAFTVSLFA